jgi:hypothetical protein
MDLYLKRREYYWLSWITFNEIKYFNKFKAMTHFANEVVTKHAQGCEGQTKSK